MLKILKAILLDKTDDPEFLGWYGEELISKELKHLNIDGKIVRNLYIPKDDGTTTEIDVIFITRKGLFVIESKNYSGWIFGDDKSKFWTSSFPNGQKNQFFNPIFQNRTHVKWLDRYLIDYIPMYSFIVFSERCELKKITVRSNDVLVMKRNELKNNIKNVYNGIPEIMSNEQINYVYEKLLVLTNVSEAVKLGHIQNINNKYKEKEIIPANMNTNTFEDTYKYEDNFLYEEPPKQTKPDPEYIHEFCPKCGHDLVVRETKSGKNQGKRFVGCSNFPKCRYMRKLDD